MKAKQFWYPLPERLIAQHPAERRGTERMMVLHRDTGVIEHRHISDIVEYLTPDDLLVVNDTKVFPARLIGTWSDTPGEVEMLMIAASPESETVRELVWNVMVGSGRKCREGQIAVFGPNAELKARLVSKLEGIGMWKVQFECARPLMDLLDEFGRTPVPPYVRREGTREEELADRERYQTIYAKNVGSVAAPTAGLHFTEEIFAALEAKGVKRCSVTLHVGPGTFRPVKVEDIEDHHMDFEAFRFRRRLPRRSTNARLAVVAWCAWDPRPCARSRRWLAANAAKAKRLWCLGRVRRTYSSILRTGSRCAMRCSPISICRSPPC